MAIPLEMMVGRIIPSGFVITDAGPIVAPTGNYCEYFRLVNHSFH
jgi:hypothetical protein